MSATQSKTAHYKVPRQTYKKAQKLRREMTKPERIMWKHLRDLPEELTITLRRQQPIHPYIVDFICLKLKLVIEIDGESHDSRQEYDKQRDVTLKRLGYVTQRFTNDEVLTDIEAVMQTVIIKAKELLDKTEHK